MIELHLIGYTSDLRYLVVEVDGGDGAVRYRLPVDADLLLTLDEIRANRREAGFDDPPPPSIEPEAVHVPTDDAADQPLFGQAGPDRAPGPDPDRTAPSGPPGAVEPEDVAADDDLDDERPADEASSTEAEAHPGPSREEPVPDGAQVDEVPVRDDAATTDGEPADGVPADGVPADEVSAHDDAVTTDDGPADDAAAEDDGDAEAEPEGATDVDERVESRLRPAEIQSMLRQGTSPRTVAERAGTEVSWVERWLPPILAERRQVLEEAQGMRLERPRLGTSRQPLGQAVMSNLRSKRVDPDDVRWSAKRRMDGSWTVSVRYRGRKRWRTASWRLDRERDRLSPASDLARELGFARARRRGR